MRLLTEGAEDQGRTTGPGTLRSFTASGRKSLPETLSEDDCNEVHLEVLNS